MSPDLVVTAQLPDCRQFERFVAALRGCGGSERFRIDARLMAITEKMKVRHVVGQGDEKAVKVAAN
jgi:hypothetical protein